jgi:hypothetical protein
LPATSSHAAPCILILAASRWPISPNAVVHGSMPVAGRISPRPPSCRPLSSSCLWSCRWPLHPLPHRHRRPHPPRIDLHCAASAGPLPRCAACLRRATPSSPWAVPSGPVMLAPPTAPGRLGHVPTTTAGGTSAAAIRAPRGPAG